jgi:3-oxoacyl-[acyl-carrier-protein] synthase III
MSGLRVAGWGAALPDKRLTNADLEARLDTSDAWIRERTGIAERRIGDSTTDVAAEAARAALAHAGVDPAQVDLLIVCTSTPDQQLPPTSSQVHRALGLSGGAMDLNVACSGFVYGLVTANGLLSGGARRVLLVGAETMSRMVDWEDRTTAVLFGDGAGALLLEGAPGNTTPEETWRLDTAPGTAGLEQPSNRRPVPGLVAWDAGTDGALRHLLWADHGGFLQMDGPELFRRAVRVIVESAQRVLATAGASVDDVALLVPHQANTRIVDAACSRLGLPTDRVASVLATTGNTSAASVPLALVDALEHGRVRQDDLVLFSGFGSGMTWATALLRWGSAPRTRTIA